MSYPPGRRLRPDGMRPLQLHKHRLRRRQSGHLASTVLNARLPLSLLHQQQSGQFHCRQVLIAVKLADIESRPLRQPDRIGAFLLHLLPDNLSGSAFTLVSRCLRSSFTFFRRSRCSDLSQPNKSHSAAPHRGQKRVTRNQKSAARVVDCHLNQFCNLVPGEIARIGFLVRRIYKCGAFRRAAIAKPSYNDIAKGG